MPPLRRAGIARHNEKLLSRIEGVSREEYDAGISSPDVISSTVAPPLWTTSKPKPPNPAKRVKLDRNSTPDDLVKPDAPTVAKAATKARSRQPSVDTERSTKSSRSETKDQSLDDSIDEADSTDSNPRNYLGALIAGKSPEEAKKDAERKVRRVSPGKTWDDGTGKRKQKAYGSRSNTTFKSAPKNTAAANRAKVGTPSDSMSIDSSASGDEKTKKKQSLLKDGAKPAGTKPPVKKSVKSSTGESSADEDPFISVKSKGAFIDPMKKYEAPPPATKVKTDFINPCKEYPLPINKSHYEELGIENKIASTTFKNPLERYDTTRPATRSNTASKLNEFRTEHSDRDIYEITSSQTEPAEPNSQSSNGESRSPLSSHDKKTMDLMSDMAALAGIKDIEAYRREIQSGDSGEDKCRLCLCPLPDGYLEPWKDQSIDGIIRLEMWTKICQSHTRETLEDEWRKKGYPKPDWRTLASRITKHLRVLKKIIADKVNSRFRDQFAQQQKEIKGNTAMLLRQERKLTFPGYYGPRGGDILLDAIMSQLGSRVGDAAKKDPLIGRGGVSAFIQQVLVPEVAVRLIAEDMKVSELAAFKILEESVEIGEKLNSAGESGDLYSDADGDNWVDVNATQRKQSLMSESWEEMDY